MRNPFIIIPTILIIFSWYSYYHLEMGKYWTAEDLHPNLFTEILGVTAEITIIFLSINLYLEWRAAKSFNPMRVYTFELIDEQFRGYSFFFEHLISEENFKKLIKDSDRDAVNKSIIDMGSNLRENVRDELQYLNISFTPEISKKIVNYQKAKNNYLNQIRGFTPSYFFDYENSANFKTMYRSFIYECINCFCSMCEETIERNQTSILKKYHYKIINFLQETHIIDYIPFLSVNLQRKMYSLIYKITEDQYSKFGDEKYGVLTAKSFFTKLHEHISYLESLKNKEAPFDEFNFPDLSDKLKEKISRLERIENTFS